MTSQPSPPWPLVVCDRNRVGRFARILAADFPERPLFVASLLDPGCRLYRPPALTPSRHLQLFFEDDRDRVGRSNPPQPHHVEGLLHWGAGLPEDASLIVHCEAGRCRSTAALLLILAQKLGTDRLDEAAALVAATRPSASPNPLMVADGAVQLGMPTLVAVAEDLAARRTERELTWGTAPKLLVPASAEACPVIPG